MSKKRNLKPESLMMSHGYKPELSEGSIKSPIQVGGGITFGPSPRSFSKRIPRKMNRNAIKSMLSDKLSDKKVLE